MVSSIYTPESFTVYGGLDSAIFSNSTNKDEPYDAHLLRSMALASNRLKCRGAPLLNLVWPTRGAGESGGSGCTVRSHVQWIRPFPPIIVPKKTYINAADVSIRIFGENTEVIYCSVKTKDMNRHQTSFSGSNVFSVTCNGTSFANGTISNIKISESSDEVFEFYFSSETQGDLVYGGGGAEAASWINFGPRSIVNDTGAGWTINEHANRACIFTDNVGTPVAGVKRILNNDAENLFLLDEINAGDNNVIIQNSMFFEIRETVMFDISNIAVAAKTRIPT